MKTFSDSEQFTIIMAAIDAENRRLDAVNDDIRGISGAWDRQALALSDTLLLLRCLNGPTQFSPDEQERLFILVPIVFGRPVGVPRG